MTRIEGHPPAANYGPEIHLPKGYDGFGAPIYDWTPCTVCDGDADDPRLCSDCRYEGREDGAVEAERARWEES